MRTERSIRAEHSEARFPERERSERSAFFAHVFAASGSRSARTRAGKRWSVL